MPEELQSLMERLGWMLVTAGGKDLEWRKFDRSGAPLGIKGDQVWLRDIAACETSLKVKESIERGETVEEPRILENPDIVRVIRILEYVGPRDWIEHCLKHRAVKEIFLMGNNAYISEAFLQRVPESVILKELKIGVGKKARKNS